MIRVGAVSCQRDVSGQQYRRSTMSKQTNDFQQLITMIMELLVDGEVVESKEFPDPDTDEPREVDIYALVKGKLPDGRQIRIAVECIAWSRKADAPWVEKMYGKHCRLQVADIVLLVSNSGFYGPAEKKARAFGYVTVHPRIKPRTLSKKLGLAGDLHMGAKMMTVTFGPTVGMQLAAPYEGWQLAGDGQFRRPDGAELIAISDYRGHGFMQEMANDSEASTELMTQQAAKLGATVVIEDPAYEGHPLYVKVISPDGRELLVPVEKVMFRVTFDVSEAIELAQTETGDFGGVAFATGSTTFEGKPARMVLAEDAHGNWKGKATWHYEVKPSPAEAV